jgi:hypothetical protein
MRQTQWAPTAPDARWVPTVLMVEEHADLSWQQIRRQQRDSGPRRIQTRRAVGIDAGAALMALLSFVAGGLVTLVTLAARGVWL